MSHNWAIRKPTRGPLRVTERSQMYADRHWREWRDRPFSERMWNETGGLVHSITKMDRRLAVGMGADLDAMAPGTYQVTPGAAPRTCPACGYRCPESGHPHCEVVKPRKLRPTGITERLPAPEGDDGWRDITEDFMRAWERRMERRAVRELLGVCA